MAGATAPSASLSAGGGGTATMPTPPADGARSGAADGKAAGAGGGAGAARTATARLGGAASADRWMDAMRRPSLASFGALVCLCCLAVAVIASANAGEAGDDGTAETELAMLARSRAGRATTLAVPARQARAASNAQARRSRATTTATRTTTSTSTTTSAARVDAEAEETDEQEAGEEDTRGRADDAPAHAREEAAETPEQTPPQRKRRSQQPHVKPFAYAYPPTSEDAPPPPWLDALKGIVLPGGRGVPAELATGGGGASGGAAHAVPDVVLTRQAIHQHGARQFPSGVTDDGALGKLVKNGCVPSTDVRNFARTCAVVGNSGILLNDRYGTSIDDHDIVIRFNDGPTVGFEDTVGSRTTFRVLNNKWTSTMLSGATLSLGPRLSVNSSVLLFGKTNVRHIGGVCGKLRRVGGYPATREVLYMSPLITDLARLTYRRVHARLYDDAACKGAECSSAMGAPPSGIEGIFFAMSVCSHVSLFGFGVDAAASKEARYHYHNGIQGDRSAHSFGYQSRFLKTLRASGRLALCNEASRPAWATRQCKRPQLIAELESSNELGTVSFDTTRLCQW